MKTRRKFLTQLATTSGLLLPSLAKALDDVSIARNITFGIIADPHKDIIPDADRRLDAFLEEALAIKPDFVINLGDFCFGKKENTPFLDRFRKLNCPSFHVLGNHDMDYNSKEEMVGFLGMEHRYYSFDLKGVHFIVLDANHLYRDGKFIAYEKSNFYVDDRYREFVDDEQIEWFKSDLAATQKPVIVFSHQSLYHYSMGVKNRMEIQLIMENENKKAGKRKVIACFNGHDHLDMHRELNGISYFDINSMAYQWYNTPNYTRFDKSLYEQYKLLGNMAMYKDPLYAFVTVNEQSLQVKGVRSEWVPPSPHEAGEFKAVYGNEGRPSISDYSIRW